jgi:site-specific DNA-methyltransferase (adenine-specific)
MNFMQCWLLLMKKATLILFKIKTRMSNIDLKLGDCLDVMKAIKDKSIDMILCDLPYGTTQNKWDSVIPFELLWKQYKRITKDNSAIVLTAQSPFDKVLANSNIKDFRYEWIWEKNVASGHLNIRWMPMKSHENILIFYKEPPTYNPQFEVGVPYTQNRNSKKELSGNYNDIKRIDTINKGKRNPKTILKFDREIGLHPTQKPLLLMEYLIKTYSNEGDTILDNTMGSGTTMIACDNLNRDGIGIEKELKYFDISVKRLKENRFTLFTQQ